APPRAVEDLPPAVAGGAQKCLEPPRGGVALLHALPLGERVPEEHHSDDPVRLGGELPLPEEEAVVSEFDGKGVARGDVVDADHAQPVVGTADLGPAEIDIEVPA